MRGRSTAMQMAVVSTMALVGAVLVLCFVSNASFKRVELVERSPALERQAQLARTQELWFGAGVTDDLNRMVRIGQTMSPQMSEYLRRGMRAQSEMVHLDQFHQSEAQQAAGESDVWDQLGGNNNGGNKPCMAAEGECP
eukprot:CAMPEP_0181325436 /NCGR_PEP_ID=MMETSP1101-20121128/20919_1 /TAXON_ID=46948 /ORGANISM="Rhodomonas abbreviata, Strain Caron Lab Isolate" /LENGTH=138 /DNA_ID=CAMNT_0023433733 /DNA_START=1 /DNA_END=417 /DNA_ORIENTATION=+